jgi:hypothetical protein
MRARELDESLRAETAQLLLTIAAAPAGPTRKPGLQRLEQLLRASRAPRHAPGDHVASAAAEAAVHDWRVETLMSLSDRDFEVYQELRRASDKAAAARLKADPERAGGPMKRVRILTLLLYATPRAETDATTRRQLLSAVPEPEKPEVAAWLKDVSAEVLGDSAPPEFGMDARKPGRS